MRVLKTGDPCLCCGKPILLTDPDVLRLLAAVADIVGLPEPLTPGEAAPETEKAGEPFPCPENMSKRKCGNKTFIYIEYRRDA